MGNTSRPADDRGPTYSDEGVLLSVGVTESECDAAVWALSPRDLSAGGVECYGCRGVASVITKIRGRVGWTCPTCYHPDRIVEQVMAQ